MSGGIGWWGSGIRMGAFKISKSPSTTSSSVTIAALPMRMVWWILLLRRGGAHVVVMGVGGSRIEIWPCPLLLVVIMAVWLRVRFH